MLRSDFHVAVVVVQVFLLCAGCISSIEPQVALPAEEIRIIGHGFGKVQGDGYVSFTQGDTEVELHEVHLWSERAILLASQPEPDRL